MNPYASLTTSHHCTEYQVKPQRPPKELDAPNKTLETHKPYRAQDRVTPARDQFDVNEAGMIRMANGQIVRRDPKPLSRRDRRREFARAGRL